MSSVVSLSSASTVPTAVWFSAGLKVAEEVNAGAALVASGRMVAGRFAVALTNS